MSLDKSKLVIALHSLAPHDPGRPLAVIGSHNRIIGEHARFDEKANCLVARLPYEVWEKEGAGIVQAGTNPTNQWFPKVETKEEAQSMKPTQSPAESAGYIAEPTHAPLQDKLPEEVTPGHLTLPEKTDTTHIPEEQPRPVDQRTATDDHRIQMVQNVVLPAGEEDTRPRVLPSNAPELAGKHEPDIVGEKSLADVEVNAQPTPKEQHEATDDPRILAVQDVVVGSEENTPTQVSPGKEKDVAKAELKEDAEEKKTDRHADLDEADGDFRALRKIAKGEDIKVPAGMKDADDLRQHIENQRDEAAGKA